MTINQAQHARQISTLRRLLIIGIIVFGAFAIYMYNQTVAVRHAFRSSEVALSQMQVKNADLKNALYSLLDAKRLVSVAQELGLVKDTAPAYLNLRLTDASAVKTVASQYP